MDYIHQPYCDYGEIVPNTCTAIVFNPDFGAKMIMPNKLSQYGASKGELALAAFFQKLGDEEWVDNLIEEVFNESGGFSK